MTWEWSHTAEGYAAAYENLHDLPHEELVIIAAEWDTWKRSKEKKVVVDDESGEEEEVDVYDSDFDQVYYAERIEHYKTLPNDVLADYIWPMAEEQSNCTNGGHQLWMCPYDCHTVPPHRADEDEEEEE